MFSCSRVQEEPHKKLRKPATSTGFDNRSMSVVIMMCISVWVEYRTISNVLSMVVLVMWSIKQMGEIQR